MSILKIKESVLYCRNLEETREFYHEVLGFPVIDFVEGHHIFFSAGTTVLLCFNPETSKLKKSPPPHYARGPQHIAFEVKEADYVNWNEKLQKLNIEIIDEITWDNGLKSFYFRDPDSHILEIVPRGIWHPY